MAEMDRHTALQLQLAAANAALATATATATANNSGANTHTHGTPLAQTTASDNDDDDGTATLGSEGGHFEAEAEGYRPSSSAAAAALLAARDAEVASLGAVVSELRDALHAQAMEHAAAAKADEAALSAERRKVADLTAALAVASAGGSGQQNVGATSFSSSPSSDPRVGASTSDDLAMLTKRPISGGGGGGSPSAASHQRLRAEKAAVEEALRAVQRERDELLAELEHAAAAVEEHLTASPRPQSAAVTPREGISGGGYGDEDYRHSQSHQQSPAHNTTDAGPLADIAAEEDGECRSGQHVPIAASAIGGSGGGPELYVPEFGEYLESAGQTHTDFVETQLRSSYLEEEF